MEKEEFLANNRGINEGEDLPPVFLEDLYQRILEEEIKTEDTKLYPNALKRGFLYLERKSRIRGKRKLVKLWFILDTESDGLYAFKKETVRTTTAPPWSETETNPRLYPFRMKNLRKLLDCQD